MLELLASISVALVAVGVGLRLIDGKLGLETALMVLILAPEAYLPLRQVGAALPRECGRGGGGEEVFRVLETPLPERGERTDVPDLRTHALHLHDVTVRYPGRDRSRRWTGFDLELWPGEVVALTGASGAGQVDSARGAARASSYRSGV